MAVYTCVGIREVNFKGSDGNQVSGLNLYFTCEDPNVQGVLTDKVFVPSSRFARMSYIPKVGGACGIVYNRYGKVADIVKA